MTPRLNTLADEKERVAAIIAAAVAKTAADTAAAVVKTAADAAATAAALNNTKDPTVITQIALQGQAVKNIEIIVKDIQIKLENNYVTNDKHELVIEKVSKLEKLVYGLLSLVATALVLGAMSFLIRKPI